MRYLTLIALLFVSTANAGDVNISLRSQHVGGNNYNEDNYGVHYLGDGYMVGVFQNSLDNTSVHAQKLIDTPISNTTLGVGVATGYRQPFIATINVDLGPANVTYAPGQNGGAFLLSVTVWRNL